MTRSILVVAELALLNVCGASQQVEKGYQSCMSNKRKAFSDQLSAYTEACGRQDNMSRCMIFRPYFNADSEQYQCKNEYGIKR